jgi:predicted transcriptional regulator
MLFTIVGTMDDKEKFGETASMFEGIDEADLQNKLQDAMKNITGLFAGMNTDSEKDTPDTNPEQGDEKSLPDDLPNMEGFKNMFKNMPNMEGMPDLDNLQSSLKSMFDGKIGELAKEMAEDIAEDFKDVLGDDIDTNADPQNILKKLMKNPAKISNLMKSVSSKLDAKMKDGSISKEELMKEAGEMMNKMKDMGGEGGGENFKEMFKNMAKSMGGMGKNMKFDQNAMDRMTKREDRISKMKNKADKQRQEKEHYKQAEFEKIKQRIQAQNEARQKCSVTHTDDPNHLVFKIDGDGDQEKTFIHPDLEKIMQAEDEAKENTLAKKTKKKKKKSKK